MTKWYENIARMRNIPLIMIDIPYNNTVDVHDTNVAYVRAQFDSAIKQLEELTGKKFDEKKFEQACANANRTAQAWLRVCDYLQYKPSPYSGFDLFNHMADVVTARGKVAAAEAWRRPSRTAPPPPPSLRSPVSCSRAFPAGPSCPICSSL